MNNQLNDEFLAAARNEKLRGMEYENKILYRSTLIATIIMICVGLILCGVKYFFEKKVDLGMISLVSTVISIQLLFEGISLKTMWKTIIGILTAIIALLALIAFFWQVTS